MLDGLQIFFRSMDGCDEHLRAGHERKYILRIPAGPCKLRSDDHSRLWCVRILGQGVHVHVQTVLEYLKIIDILAD